MSRSTRKYQMYGTRNYRITEYGEITDPMGRVIVTESQRHGPDVKFTIDDEDKHVECTLPEFCVFTFYGYTKSPIHIRYPNEPFALSNCEPVFTLKSRDKDHIISEQDEVFTRFFEAKYGNFIYYISDHGAVVEEFIDANKIARYSFRIWSYNQNGYPRAPVYSGAFIHILVYEIYGSERMKDDNGEYMDIHHRDNCRWNADVHNLEQVSRSDHLKIHGIRQYLKTTYDGFPDSKIELAFKMMSEDAYYTDIVDAITDGDTSRQNAARCLIHRILSKKTSFQKFRDKYDISVYTKSKGNHYDRNTIIRACSLLASEIHMSDGEIGKECGMSASMIRNIRLGRVTNKIIQDVIDEYGFKIDPKVRKPMNDFRIFTDEDVLKIVDLCKASNLTDTELADMFHCSYDSIAKIRNGTASAYQHILNGPVECMFNQHDRKYKNDVIICDPKTGDVIKTYKPAKTSVYLKRTASKNPA